MRAVVTCECCGHRQAIARQIVRPESFNLICHSCEGVLRVEVTVNDLQADLKQFVADERFWVDRHRLAVCTLGTGVQAHPVILVRP